LSAYEAEKSAIAKLPLDAATRMPGCLHRHISHSPCAPSDGFGAVERRSPGFSLHAHCCP